MQKIKSHWPKFLASFLFVVLFAAYANIFAVFTPGQTLDPNCAPGAVGCVVDSNQNLKTINGNSLIGSGDITVGGSSHWTTTGDDIYFTSGNVGVGTTTPTAKLAINASIIPVGLELITNGTFNTDSTGWNLNEPGSYNAGKLDVHYTGAEYDAGVSTSIYTESGKTYLVKFSISNVNNDTVYPYFMNNNYDGSDYGAGDNSFIFTADYTGTDTLWFEDYYWNEPSSWSIDNVSAKEISSSPSDAALEVYNFNGNKVLSLGDASNSIALGNDAGSGATTSSGSVFLGNYSGIGINSTTNSNFIGNYSGYKVNNADFSNYIGSYSGTNSVNSSYSNYFGVFAGQNTSGSGSSNFIGPSAGSGSSSSWGSNFIGQWSGFNADNADRSNFFGSEAGSETTGASKSNFLGYRAGYQATGAGYSNFLGNTAGYQASAAIGSNFLGSQAGYIATNASYSNFLGQVAGGNATNASFSNFFGFYAGIFATNAANSNFIGANAGDYSTNAANSNFVGVGSGHEATNAANSNFFGYQAGGGTLDYGNPDDGAFNAANSIFIGTRAGFDDTVNNTVNADDFSILIGNKTNTGGFSNSIAIGGSATNTATNQLTIGSAIRPINKLYIAGLNYDLPTVQGSASSVLTNDGSGILTWAAPSTGSSYTFGNGLTETGGVVGLGGVLNTGSISIGGYPGPSVDIINEVDDAGIYLAAVDPLQTSSSYLDIEGYENYGYAALSTRGGNSSDYYSSLYLESDLTTPGTTKQTFDLFARNMTSGTNRVGVFGSSETTGGVDIRLLKFEIKSLTDTLTITVPDVNVVSGSKYLPLSVNGVFADATGNITIAAGGGLSSDAEFNTKGGTDSGLNLISGAQNNTFLGFSSGKSSTSGTFREDADNNTAVGYMSMFSNNDGYENTAVGAQSLYSSVGGGYNTAFGYQSLYTTTSSWQNTAVGHQALYSTTSGSYNTGTGDYALWENTTGQHNVANGFNSLSENIVGSYNASVGSNSMTASRGSYNAAVGYQSLYGSVTLANNTGTNNVALGYKTLYGYSSGSNNIAIGYRTADNLTTGSNNIIIGSDVDVQLVAGTNQLTIGNLIFGTGGFGTGTTIGAGNIGIANTAPAYRLHVGNNSSSGVIARFENSTGTCDINPTSSSLVCSSDINLKKNITEINQNQDNFILDENINISGTVLDKLLSLTPVQYNWLTEADGDDKHVGLIAQEVEQIFPDVVFTDFNTDLKSIAYTNLTPYTIQAIKEMDLKVKELDLKISGLTLGDMMTDFYGGIVEQVVDGVKGIAVGNLKVGSPTKRTGITLYDEVTGEPYCLSIANGQTKTVEGECPIISVEETTIPYLPSQPATESEEDADTEVNTGTDTPNEQTAEVATGEAAAEESATKEEDSTAKTEEVESEEPPVEAPAEKAVNVAPEAPSGEVTQ